MGASSPSRWPLGVSKKAFESLRVSSKHKKWPHTLPMSWSGSKLQYIFFGDIYIHLRVFSSLGSC